MVVGSVVDPIGREVVIVMVRESESCRPPCQLDRENMEVEVQTLMDTFPALLPLCLTALNHSVVVATENTAATVVVERRLPVVAHQYH